MTKKDVIDSFKNLNISTYLNSTLQTSEQSIIENELHQHEKHAHQLSESIFQTFSMNTEHLIQILEKNHLINKLLKDIRLDLDEYKKIFDFEEEEEEQIFDIQKRKDYEKIMKKFGSEGILFMNHKRILIFSEIFVDDKRNEHLLVFSNDLLIIGKKTEDTYKLSNAFNYHVIKMEGENEKLIICVEPFKFIFEKDKNSVKKAINIFKEIVFKSKNTIVQNEEKEEDPTDYIRFLVKTEQFGKLISLKGEFEISFDVQDVKEDENLFILLRLIKDKRKTATFMFEYFEFIFDQKMVNLNVVQKLKNIIDDIFNQFKTTYTRIKQLYILYENEFGVDHVNRSLFILFLEKVVCKIFNLLKKRIYGKYASIRESEKYIDQIRDYLEFDAYDFKFLIEYFKNERKIKEDEIIKKGKESIKNIINDMIEQDNVE